jgi:hypothetical protein
MSTPVPQQPVNLPPPPAPPPPGPGKKSSTRARITLLVLVLLLAVGGYFAWQNWGTAAARTNPGDCVSVTGASFDPKFEKLSCDSPDVTHVVAKSLGTSGESCGDAYDEFTQTLDGKPVAKLCLIPNLVEGTCLKNSIVQIESAPEKVDCGSADAIKVVKVVKGKGDKALCPEGAEATVYQEPPLTQCLALASDS